MAAVLTEPDVAKAGVLPDGGMIRYSFPIDKGKTQDTAEINPVDGTPDLIIWGKCTDGTLDSDLQIVDPDASLRWVKTWYDTKANVRMSHDPRSPVGKGLEIDGHYVKSLIADPKAKHLIRNGILNDYSVGIINPDVRKGDPRFRHLDPMGKAVNGIITDRQDGLTQLGEISVVDRGANYGSAFSLVKAASDGTPEWTGTWDTELEDTEGVTLTLPKDVSVTMKPSDLARLATFKQQLIMQRPAAKTAAPAVLNKAADITDDADEVLATAAKTAEAGVYKRDVSTAERRELHGQGRALDNLSYPVKTHEDADNAVTLALSGHGNVAAAKRMLKRIARKEGWQDILDRLKGAGKKNSSKTAAVVPDVTKCGTCDGSGMAGGKPCPDCDDGKNAAKAAAALDAAVTVPVAEIAEKKRKAMCGHCGALQNIKHAHCPECGHPLHPGAIPVPKLKKNHDFACLGCGNELDKGEKFCPSCGKENPGYLPEADHKIPANKNAKERVSTQPPITKGRKNKKGAKKGKPFGGKQAPSFGDDAKDGEAKPDAGKRRKGKGKGRSPAAGVKGHETMGLPPHREPDGPPVEAFEQTTSLEDGDHEMKTALRHKSLGIPPHLAVLHDLTCEAFAPADVTKALPGASFAAIDTGWWLEEALKAASSNDVRTAQARFDQAQALSQAAVTLKTADAQILQRVRVAAHQAFLAANKDALKTFHDATPGPGSSPTPGHVVPGAFRRPYISAGHAAESPQATGPRTFPVSEHHPEAQDYTRGYISAGHAAESPGNHEPRSMPVPEHGTGMASVAGAAASMHEADYEHARSAMHDHLSRIAPGICPMSPEPPGTQKPAPQVPEGVGHPEPHSAKAVKPKPTKAERQAAAARKAAKAAQAKARKAQKALKAQQRATLKAAAASVPVAASEVVPEVPAVTPEAITAAVKAATAPLIKRQKAQAVLLRKQRKILNAVAGQPDTSTAPFRGAGSAPINKASAPAAPTTPAEAAALAQTGYMQRLNNDWRNSPNPEVREAAYKELSAQLGLNPITGTEPTTHPFTR